MASDSVAKRHLVRFEDNNSKKWDGKEVWLDAYVLDELYDSKELLHGAKISVPFKGKGGKITHWNAIYVDPEEPAPSQSVEEPAATTDKSAAPKSKTIQTTGTG